MLLGVVAQSLKPVKLLDTWKQMQQLPTMLRPFAPGLYLALRTLKRFKAFAQWNLVVLKKKIKNLDAYEHLVPALEDFLWSTVANRSLFYAI